MYINVELFCDCIVGVIGPEHLLVDGSGVFTKGNENVHCQSSKKDVIRAAENEDFGKRALGGDEGKTFCLWCEQWQSLEHSQRWWRGFEGGR